MGKVYTNTKIFHFADRLEQLKSGRIPSPIHIRLKPTNRCNHRCTYCCYRNTDLILGQLMDENDQLPRNTMLNLVQDMADMGVKAVTFSGGGEPLCYPHITETIQALAEKGIKIAMLSNGGLLHGKVAELLARKAVWLRISMDATTAENYATSRGVSLAEFTRVCDNLQSFAALPGRKCVLGINLIVTQANSDHVSEFLTMVRDIGVNHVKVSGVVVSTDPTENNTYHQPIYAQVRKQLDTARHQLVTNDFDIVDLYHRQEERREIYLKEYHWCPMSLFLVVIGADQQVYTCQDKAYSQEGLIGSIRDQGFAAMWRSEETRQRHAALDPSQACRHHCVAHRKNLMLLDYFEADPAHLDFV